MTLLRKYWPGVFLVLISSFIAILNYAPGTWLSGWDTLHPEFNFGLNIQRELFGVFRQEQGLGAVAGHSHMADLPRLLLLYLVSFILPTELIRYFYIFLCLIAGPLGMYLFLHKFVLKEKISSFLGALFYLLNLGTVQIFNVPFEMFTTLYAAIPFVFYFATKYLVEEKSPKNLLFFALSIIFVAPAAYAATLWYAFFASLCLYIILFSLSKNGIKKAFTLIGITILLNLFWIAPNIYFVLNHSVEVQSANINLLFSESAFLKNKEFGNLGSLLTLKTFYFDWSIYGPVSFINLLSPFVEHFKDIKFNLLSIAIGFSWIIGLITYIFKTKKSSLPLIIPFVLSAIFMINSNFPTGAIYDYLQTHFPLFKEALRFPQNKFLNMYVFFVSIFFGYFVFFLKTKLKGSAKEAVITCVIAFLLILYCLPIFSGNLINKQVKVKIPESYFQLFDYLKTQPKDLKVSNLPINSQWGWVYYRWGFQGAGFLYFGIKQPLLDRDFDRWSPYNESYYREASYALYKKDASLFANTLKKYDVGYIFIDKNVFDPSHPDKSLFFDESDKLLMETGLVKEIKSFGKIKLYRIENTNSNFSLIKNGTSISPTAKSLYNDVAYSVVSDYFTSAENSVYYPFRDLVNNQGKLISRNVSIEKDRIKFGATAETELENLELLTNTGLTPSDLVLNKGADKISLSFYPSTLVFDDNPSSSPLKAELNSNGQFISINQKYLFDLNSFPKDTPLLAGKVVLEPEKNQISLYNTQNFKAIESVSKIINPFFESCDEKAPPQAQINGNKIQVKGYGQICVLIPYGFFPSVEEETITNFGFEYKGDAQVKSCLFDQKTSVCTTYKDPVIEKTGNTNLISFLYVLGKEDSGKNAIRLFFDKAPSSENNFEISNFFASSSKAIQSLELQNNIQAQKNISFKNIFVPKDPLEFTQLQKSVKIENDCETGTDAKKEVIKENELSTIKYSASLGSFCDHYKYSNLPHNFGYFVIINSKNEAGLPLTLCITNYTSRRCDIYTSLSEHSQFKDEVFVLPPSDKNGIGYDINVENTAVKATPAINYLTNIEFIPIPWETLGQISQGQANELSTKEALSSKPLNPFAYSVKPQTPGILALDFSFEKGFRAYQVKDNSFLQKILPFVFGKELKEHVLVNNWANGWVIPASFDKDSSVEVIFLPQYLELMGLFIVVTLLITLVIRTKHSPHN